jgi:hypothetical protein
MVNGYVGKAADSFEPKDADDPPNTAMNAVRALLGPLAPWFGRGVRCDGLQRCVALARVWLN